MAFFLGEVGDVEVDEAEGGQHDGGGDQRHPIHAVAASQSDGGGDPEAGGGSQTAHHLFLENDGARADEADARDHLRGDTRRVEAHVLAPQHEVEAVNRENHEQTGTQRH